MIKVSVSSSLRKRLLGKGNIYFYHALGRESEAWHWAEGRQTALQAAGALGVLQQYQNRIASLLEQYLERMSETARKNFERNWFFSIHYKEMGGREYAYNTREEGQETMNLARTEPISKHFFNAVTKRGKVIRGSFGNSSSHAAYVEWGTGPIGKENIGNISRRMMDLFGRPKYKGEAWTYYNYQVGHFVRTEGMPPRPFVYPAFLSLKKAFLADCRGILRLKEETTFLQTASLDRW